MTLRTRLGLVSLVPALTAGCAPFLPPVNPGFVGLEARSPGAVDGGGQVGVLSVCAQEDCTSPFGGITGRIEPYADAQLSIPIEAAFVTHFQDGGLYVLSRAGLRYRLTDRLAVGAGVGPNFLISEGSTLPGVAADVEIAFGGPLQGASAWSLALRPGYAFMSYDGGPTHAFALPTEVALMGDVGKSVRIGGSLMGGVGYASDTVWGAFGASFVVAAHAEGRD